MFKKVVPTQSESNQRAVSALRPKNFARAEENVISVT